MPAKNWIYMKICRVLVQEKTELDKISEKTKNNLRKLSLNPGRIFRRDISELC
jgi:hypothetical protein